MFNMLIDIFYRGQFIRYALYSHEFKFKYIPDTIVFNPRIHKMKKSVISPNTGFNLFVNLDDIPTFFAGFELLSGLMKFSVFRKSTAR